ncbi:molybdopterin converting factor subunit 1 [Bacillus sp. CGMCC 1.16607]|uniref:molybdopterin converting factor subunit 1 n=1 Tax=Bacillus sp. CGMCC 1.16607 TaxID=3351842 RepID=UPI0036441A8F
MNKVLFFAHLRDITGSESIDIQATGKTVAQLKHDIAAQFGFQKLDTVMTAINEEFATDEEMIQEGDTIAFIPPVSGG